MAADPAIAGPSAEYIRIESVANVLIVLAQFALVALVTVNKSGYLYAQNLVESFNKRVITINEGVIVNDGLEDYYGYEA